MMPRRVLPLAALWVVLLASLAHAATPTISAAAYRARLEAARNSLDQLQHHPPVNATKILGGLKSDILVKRSDGATQLVHGDEWAKRLSVPSDGSNAAKLTGPQARNLRAAFAANLKALDEWNTPKNGTYYKAATAAQTMFAQLEATGQIQTKPPWWLTFSAGIKKWFSDKIAAFFKWFGSLLPTRSPSARLPDLRWLWFVFWAIVVALLSVILFFVYRIFGHLLGPLAELFSWLPWVRRRKKKQLIEFAGEDAELLLLPPDELRQRAENFAAQGNFREALRHRFIALLLHLDGRGVWRYDIRRTNWEHIGALRREESRRPLVAPLSDLTQRFDRVRYGGAECSPTEWSRFSQDVNGLEAQVGTLKVAEVAR